MIRLIYLLFAASVVLSACASSYPTTPDGSAGYRISSSEEGEIQFRMLDAVNALRGARPIVSLAGTPIGSPAGPAFALIDSLLDLH